MITQNPRLLKKVKIKINPTATTLVSMKGVCADSFPNRREVGMRLKLLLNEGEMDLILSYDHVKYNICNSALSLARGSRALSIDFSSFLPFPLLFYFLVVSYLNTYHIFTIAVPSGQ